MNKNDSICQKCLITVSFHDASKLFFINKKMTASELRPIQKKMEDRLIDRENK